MWWSFAAVVTFALHRALTPMREHDFFFHLKLGELILEQRSIPFRNLFSFTHPRAPDLDLSWAFQVLAALTWQAGGWPAVVVGKALLFAAACALALAVCRRAGAGPLASAAAVVLAVCAADQRLVERPHLVTFVGLGVVALLLEQRRWHFIPPLILVWANFHAGVFLGIVLIAGWGVGGFLDGERPPRRWAVVLALSIAACFFSPAGTLLPTYLVWHTGLGATRIIEEFRVAELYSDPWFFTLLALALASAVAVKKWRRILPVVVVAVLAWRSVRFVAEWALLAAPLCALGLTAIGRALSLRAPAWSALAILVVLPIERRDFDVGLHREVVPFSAIEFVTREGLRHRLYANLDVGCYLLWEGWPKYSVFQDARLPAYPDDFHRALDRVEGFDALLDRYGVDAALITDPDVDMRAGSFDPEEWALIWKSADALVFTRRLPGREKLIAQYEIPLRPRFAFAGGTRFEPLTAQPARSPVERCQWRRRLEQALVDDERPDRAFEVRLSAYQAGCLREPEASELRAWVMQSYGRKVRVGR
jgi:hypothetical protein